MTSRLQWIVVTGIIYTQKKESHPFCGMAPRQQVTK